MSPNVSLRAALRRARNTAELARIMMPDTKEGQGYVAWIEGVQGFLVAPSLSGYYAPTTDSRAYFLWVLDFYRLCSRYCGHMPFPQYDWMTNSQNQNPCLVTSWPYVPCYGTGACFAPLGDPNAGYNPDMGGQKSAPGRFAIRIQDGGLLHVPATARRPTIGVIPNQSPEGLLFRNGHIYLPDVTSGNPSMLPPSSTSSSTSTATETIYRARTQRRKTTIQDLWVTMATRKSRLESRCALVLMDTWTCPDASGRTPFMRIIKTTSSVPPPVLQGYCGNMLSRLRLGMPTQTKHVQMTNSRDQSPCLVASWLYVPCYGAGAPSVVSKINPGVNYGAFDDFENRWPSYTANCLSTYDKIYPELIPGGTAVPRWAYLEVLSNNGTFNLDAAKALASQDLPDVTTGNTSVALPSPTSTIIVTVTETSAPVSNTQQSNVGAIVGGAIGGILGLLLILGIILYIVLRHRRQICGDPSIPPGSSQTVPVREVSVSETGYYPWKGEAGNIIGGYYDPDDPRTYPPATEGSGIGYTGLPQIMP
ncbi:hypothetical protein LXA43DRAFT_1079359 [Ganoderma leucocontextum]|nr:hypothetical protein LXA43DRAFT_1079359 [Ganoderma leucocontextum]